MQDAYNYAVLHIYYTYMDVHKIYQVNGLVIVYLIYLTTK